MDATVLAHALKHSLLRCVYIGFAAVVIMALYHEYLRLKSRVKGLPGPRGYPIVGNLFQIKGKPAYENYRKWAKEYGPVFQGRLMSLVLAYYHRQHVAQYCAPGLTENGLPTVQLGSLPMVIINDAQSAHDLLVKQHSAVISRPVLYTFQ